MFFSICFSFLYTQVFHDSNMIYEFLISFQLNLKITTKTIANAAVIWEFFFLI